MLIKNLILLDILLISFGAIIFTYIALIHIYTIMHDNNFHQIFHILFNSHKNFIFIFTNL